MLTDRFRPLILFAGLLFVFSGGCVKKYDFTNRTTDSKTLGEELFALWKSEGKNSEDKPQQKVQLLNRRRQDVVNAIDTLVPKSELEKTDQFLQRSLQLVDRGLLPSLTQKTSLALRAAAREQSLLEGLATNKYPNLGAFVSTQYSANTVGHLFRFPKIKAVNRTILPIPLGTTSFKNLQYVGSGVLKQISSESNKEPLSFELQDVLLTTSPKFGSGRDPIYVAAFDSRGHPVVTSAGLELDVFRDRNADGLADLTEDGRFIGKEGSETRIPAFAKSTDIAGVTRGIQGRLKTESGDFVFDYVNIGQTALPFLIRNLDDLVKNDVLYHLVNGIEPLLQPRTVREDANGPYSGFSDESPLADLTYSLLHLLNTSVLPDLLENTSSLFDQQPSALAAGAFSIEDAIERLGEYDDAGMKENQTIGYDLIPVIDEITGDPDLWADVMEALRAPINRHLGEAMKRLIQYRNWPVEPTEPYHECFHQCRKKPDHQLGSVERFKCIRNCPTDEMFSKQTDFDADESVENRSLFQRMLLLMWATTDEPIEIRAVEPDLNMPPLVDVENAAGLFIRSVGQQLDLANHLSDSADELPVVDNSDVASVLQFLSQVFGTQLDRRTKPYQLTRFLNQDDYEGFGGSVRLNTPAGKHGYKFPTKKGQADILFASEASGMTDVLHPLAEAFSRHDKERLLLELFLVIHRHYSKYTDRYRHADGSALPMKGANLRSYEPALMDLFENGSLFKGLYRLSHALQKVDEKRGNLTDELRVLLHRATEQSEGLKTRSGKRFMNLSDGRTVRELSYLHLVGMALNRASQNYDDQSEAEDHLADALSGLHEALLQTSWPDRNAEEPGEPVFDKPGTTALTSKFLSFLSDEVREAKSQNRLSEWLTEDAHNTLKEAWGSRATPALISLGQKILETDKNRQLLEQLVSHISDKEWGITQMTLSTYRILVVSMHREWWVPMANFLGAVIHPDRTWDVSSHRSLSITGHGIKLLEELAKLDRNNAGIGLLKRGMTVKNGKTPFGTLFSVALDYLRHDPASQNPYAVQDYQRAFRQLQAWMLDDTYGLEQLFELAKQRVRRRQPNR